MTNASLDTEIVIVGAGFSGIGAGVRLRREGFRDFAILDKADDLGGTWRDNDYPGLAVDMPSFIYSYPFEMSAEWSRIYAPREEIKAYADHCARKYDLLPHMRFGSRVVRADYDEAQNVWRTQLADGSVLASRYLVSASGLLIEPKLPEIDGIAEFQGKLVHSARWDHAYDLASKRVAVIGTGATAVQLLPAIVDQVAQLDVYQRTPIWLLPKPDPEIPERWKRRFRNFPFLQKAARLAINAIVEVSMGLGFIRYTRFPWIFDRIERWATESMRSQVHDPEIQEKLIPSYTFFCKRPSFSNDYFGVFNREHVELVTEPIERITSGGIVTSDGRERPVDALICATGYSVFDRRSMPTFEVVGRAGQNLGDTWQEQRFQAYEGASVAGFPNFFLFMGPYSAAGASYFTMIDTQSHHLARCLKTARRRGANYIEVKREAHERDFAKVDRRRHQTALFGGDCTRSNSYYFDAHGDTPGLRPVTGFEHWWNSRFFPLSDYRFEQRGVVGESQPTSGP